MPLQDLSDLPDDARVWIFGADRALPAEVSEAFESRVDEFLETWAAHGAPLTASRDWLEGGRFLVVAVDERSVPPSGCSIDAMVGVLKDLRAAEGIDFLDSGAVYYRSGDEVVRTDRAGFQRAISSEGLTREVRVFDLTHTRLGQVRVAGVERPASDSWHGRAFTWAG